MNKHEGTRLNLNSFVSLRVYSWLKLSDPCPSVSICGVTSFPVNYAPRITKGVAISGMQTVSMNATLEMK
jgi:hypothetical protein